MKKINDIDLVSLHPLVKGSIYLLIIKNAICIFIPYFKTIISSINNDSITTTFNNIFSCVVYSIYCIFLIKAYWGFLQKKENALKTIIKYHAIALMSLLYLNILVQSDHLIAFIYIFIVMLLPFVIVSVIHIVLFTLPLYLLMLIPYKGYSAKYIFAMGASFRFKASGVVFEAKKAAFQLACKKRKRRAVSLYRKRKIYVILPKEHFMEF